MIFTLIYSYCTIFYIFVKSDMHSIITTLLDYSAIFILFIIIVIIIEIISRIRPWNVYLVRKKYYILIVFLLSITYIAYT